nr:MAG TPA: hypothetical protein [Caudoviricetes sp.]
MVTKTTFKKKFPDVKVQKLQTSVVFSRQQVEETVLKMCDSLGVGLLYYNYSNRWITVYTSEKMKRALDSMKPGSEVFHEHYGAYGKVMSDKPFVICGELCIRVNFGGMPEGGAYSCTCFVI